MLIWLSSGSKVKRVAMKNILAVCFILILAMTYVSSRAATISRRQRRQSDQRIAELETLLALQKYGHHRLDWGRHKDISPPGYGLIDFDKIGRRKKSTRFSPGDQEKNVWSDWSSQGVDKSIINSNSGSSTSNLESQLQVDHQYIK